MDEHKSYVTAYDRVGDLSPLPATRETQYFGDPFEPGPSRAQWVERMS